ncbi:Uncharacterized protein TCM_045216 [Theobroma cacao]|uniref:Reverse transcriptase zinc-binding domain-containing protein n=1 Tax=Theobroma cacao TaxID=3641 RepID=A0A061FYG7_THECC|nr:Uncharacterized protein TCM_045216 [Theobroma cacao]
MEMGDSTERRLFGWEEEQWREFIPFLKGYHLCVEIDDCLVWKGTLGGEFSVKSFCKQTLNSYNSNGSPWKHIWTNLAPFKIEVLTWQLIHRRVAIKDELVRRAMINSSAAMCPLCDKPETKGRDDGDVFKIYKGGRDDGDVFKIYKGE